MQTIWQEIQEVKEGKADKEDNVLLNAPHPEYEVVANEWNHSYSREKAAYPIETVRENKFWINVARVDNTLGDRKLCRPATESLSKYPPIIGGYSLPPTINKTAHVKVCFRVRIWTVFNINTMQEFI